MSLEDSKTKKESYGFVERTASNTKRFVSDAKQRPSMPWEKRKRGR